MKQEISGEATIKDMKMKYYTKKSCKYENQNITVCCTILSEELIFINQNTFTTLKIVNDSSDNCEVCSIIMHKQTLSINAQFTNENL